jgi:hypothetical protein
MGGPTRLLLASMRRLGFARASVRLQMQVATRLSRRSAQAGLGAAALTGPVADRYLAAPRSWGTCGGWAWLRSRHSLGRRRSSGITCWASAACNRRWPEGYLDLVRPFAERHAADGGAGLGALTAGDVTAFLTVRSRAGGTGDECASSPLTPMRLVLMGAER